LRLQTSLLEAAKRVAEAEGVALNQFINVAVAEPRISGSDLGRANIKRAKQVLKRSGRGKPPVAGDEL
jgi:hypothetical protein